MAPSERIIYVTVRDVSGNKMRRTMKKLLKENLIKEGIVVTDDPKKANLMLNAIILSAHKTTASEAKSYLSQGYKGGSEGALLAGGIAGISGGSGSGMLGAGLAGMAVGFLADTMVEDIYFTFVMDIQMRERINCYLSNALPISKAEFSAS